MDDIRFSSGSMNSFLNNLLKKIYLKDIYDEKNNAILLMTDLISEYYEKYIKPDEVILNKYGMIKKDNYFRIKYNGQMMLSGAYSPRPISTICGILNFKSPQHDKYYLAIMNYLQMSEKCSNEEINLMRKNHSRYWSLTSFNAILKEFPEFEPYSKEIYEHIKDINELKTVKVCIHEDSIKRVMGD